MKQARVMSIILTLFILAVATSWGQPGWTVQQSGTYETLNGVSAPTATAIIMRPAGRRASPALTPSLTTPECSRQHG